MGSRRMLTRQITDDDNFLSLSSAQQALFLHLTMISDDDGFTNKTSLCMFKAHATQEDMNELINKRYIIRFPSGVVCIKHWFMANAIRKDRYTPTLHQDERSQLYLHKNNVYSFTPEDEEDEEDEEEKPQNKPLKITFK
ncbi:MAG: hypothetical protein KBT34_10010 [Prevotella sp.]|nr:hypothetical protein [Candidatus Prevotella equi]